MKKIVLIMIFILNASGCSSKEYIHDEITENVSYSLVELTQTEKDNIENVSCKSTDGEINTDDLRTIKFHYPVDITDASILAVIFQSPKEENEGKISKEIYNRSCKVKFKGEVDANMDPNNFDMGNYFYLDGESESDFINSVENSIVYVILVNTSRADKYPQYHLYDFENE